MRIGLVLAAGGSVGVAYHGAVLAALEEVTGWDPRRADIMVGTSAGSLSAAMLRAGVPAGDLARISEGESLSDEGARLAALGRPRRPRPGLLDALAFRPLSEPQVLVRALVRPGSVSPRSVALAAMPSGGIPTQAISDGIDAIYRGAWPDAHLWLCSYDLRAGRRVVFGQPDGPTASVGKAVAASCAIPAYFRPVAIDGRRYVDGGVHSMINLDLVAGAPLDLVIAVSPLSQVAPFGLPSPALVMRQALRSRLRADLDALRRSGMPVVAVQPGRSVTAVMGPNPMDASKRGAVSRATRAGVRRWLHEGLEGRHLARLLRSEAGGAVPGAALSGTA